MWNARCRAEQGEPRTIPSSTVLPWPNNWSPSPCNLASPHTKWGSLARPVVFKVCSALCTVPQKPSWVQASLWHCSLIIICSVSHGLRKLKASLITTPLDRRVLYQILDSVTDTVARAGTQMYTSPPMQCTPDAGVRGWRGECGSVSLPWAVCGQQGHNHNQDLWRTETLGRLEKGILQRLQTRWAPNSTEAGLEGMGSTGLPLTQGRKNWEKKKQNPACQSRMTHWAQDTLPTGDECKCPLSNASFLQCLSSCLQIPNTLGPIWISLLKGLARVFLHLVVNISFDNKNNEDRLWEASCEELYRHSLIESWQPGMYACHCFMGEKIKV